MRNRMPQSPSTDPSVHTPNRPTVSDRQQALLKLYPAWNPITLHEMLDLTASRFPNRPLVMTDEKTWSYQEIQKWSAHIAAGLIESGVKPGDHVALLMGNFPEFVAVKFAISRAGAVAIPINFLNRRDELGYVLKQSDAVMLITMLARLSSRARRLSSCPCTPGQSESMRFSSSRRKK